eukprot:1156477-Pelagomonas_calceolata.AAC.7
MSTRYGDEHILTLGVGEGAQLLHCCCLVTMSTPLSGHALGAINIVTPAGEEHFLCRPMLYPHSMRPQQAKEVLGSHKVNKGRPVPDPPKAAQRNTSAGINKGFRVTSRKAKSVPA